MALIAALLAAAALTADPSKLVLGKDAGADLSLRVPAGARVTLSSSVGTVGEPTRDGEVLRARFTPPSLKAPSVALVLAQVDEDGERELFWLAIPLSGSDTMEIETRPGARVEANVAGRTIGPVVADKNGIARLSMVVPPGVNKATLHTTDKLGNASDKPLDLEPPPFPRVRVAAREAGARSSAPLELEIFVVRPDGTPDDDAKVELSSKDGEAELRKRVAPGVYLGRFVARPELSGTARVEIKANGQSAVLEVPVTASHVFIAQPFWRSALASEGPWSFSAGVIAGAGSSFGGATEGTVLLEGAMRIEILPVEAVLDLGMSYFSEVTQYGGTAIAEQARSQSRLVQVGLRAGRQLLRRVDGHASLLVGLQSQVIGRTLADKTAASADGWSPRLAAALGATLQLGPGRALAQVQLDSSGAGIAGLAGRLSGVQFMAGYLVTLR